MKRYQLIGVPFDLNRPGERMGATPAALLPRLAGLPLPWAGAPVLVEPEGLAGEERADLARIAAALAAQVRTARAAGAIPVVVGGDCLVSIGTMGGLGEAAAGVVWLDAHGDFNTPETTPSGYLGGMPLAALAGRCLPELTAAAGLHTPVAEKHIALLGPRDLDPPEQDALAASPVALLTTAQLRATPEQLGAALESVAAAGPVYLHLDVDVLDAAVMPGAVYPTSDGLTLDELAAVLRTVRSRCDVAAVAITAINLAGGDRTTILDAAEAAVLAALV
ncbi:MAG TPA: arginase family protein [Roseiflexaceae bacterium]|nr:arginase family protein [Roseiflexaceae bacterium]